MNNIKSVKAIVCSAMLALATAGVSSCSYLDVVPPEQASLSDATKDHDATLSFLYSCYAGITMPMFYSGVEAASDEWVLPPLWNETMHKILYGLNLPGNLADGWRWGHYYRYVGQCLLFLRELENARGITEADKQMWIAEANFMMAYYHMQVLTQYGPCPITDSYIAMDTPVGKYNGRFHFDYVTKWITDKLDDVAAKLPATRTGSDWGRATSVMAKALKARLLVYAASPLWNGRFPYPDWKNTNFETPGYGKELVARAYDPKKWEAAKAACQEALDAAKQAGHELFADIDLYTRQGLDLPFVPGKTANKPEDQEFLKRVLLMRNVVATRTSDGNKEIIWGSSNQGNMIDGSLPHYVLTQNNGSRWGRWSGVSPLLNTSIRYFYTEKGYRPEEDTNYPNYQDWFKSANIPGNKRNNIIKLNVGREPRFYAWFAFDGGDYGLRLNNGAPLLMEARNGQAQGYNPQRYNRDNNVTGYFSQKFLVPSLKVDKNGTQSGTGVEAKPRPLIRMAELYLNLAECAAALEDKATFLENINQVRVRAGVPALKNADLETVKMTDWVRNERFIELWGEGHRYYDVRRWMLAPETMAAGKRTGLNAYGIVDPTFEQFNKEVKVDQSFVWNNRMYLLPIFHNEVYKNPQMVQAPGY